MVVGTGAGVGGGGSVAADEGTDITGGGGGGAITATDGEALAILLLVSIDSGLMKGCCDMIGCGGCSEAGVLIIGLICVDPTFIVGAVGVCCIVLITVAVLYIFAVTKQTKKAKLPF